MRRFAVAGVGLVALTIGGCKTKAPGGADSATQAGVAVSPTIYTVHAKDFAYQAPDTIAAGVVTFHLVNDGPGFHHMQIVRLDSGKTIADFGKAMKGPPPARLTLVSGPNAPNPGGGESNATLALTPGNYAFVCLVDIPDGVPHFMEGMTHAFTVTPSTGTAAAPKADVTVSLSDYAFAFSGPIAAGAHTIEVRNSAAQPHEVEIVRLAPGKTGQDFLNWMMKMNGPPPGGAVGGVAATSASETAYFTATFEKGDYLFVCFIPDAKDGKPHFMRGMMHTLTVS